jgi:ArsR family transcriptional regulator, arsenate/arsenite/antimonite-responsive transcriptional repressor / arsenate reductase (thioredoxin)
MLIPQSARPPLFVKLLAHDLRWQLVSALARSDRRVQELVALLGQPAKLVSYHLNQLRQAALVRKRPSAADHRAQYYSLNLPQVQSLFAQAGQALHPALGAGADAPLAGAADQPAQLSQPAARVLFLCTHNSARSQMAEGLLRQLSQGQVEAFSAGNEPSQVNPVAMAVMAERGIDIRGQHSKHLSQYLGQKFDYIVTVCDLARETCPVFPGAPEQIHWSFPDPAAVEEPAARRRAFETVAAELATRINFLLVLIRRQQSGP